MNNATKLRAMLGVDKAKPTWEQVRETIEDLRQGLNLTKATGLGVAQLLAQENPVIPKADTIPLGRSVASCIKETIAVINELESTVGDKSGFVTAEHYGAYLHVTTKALDVASLIQSVTESADELLSKTTTEAPADGNA